MTQHTDTILAHPNRIAFEGLLCTIGIASDKSPRGARGHKVLITPEAAQRSIDSLLGMGVNYSKEGGHDERNKIGVITKAWIDGAQILISGFLYGHDFPGVIAEIRASEGLGMSYEAQNCHISDMRSSVYEINRLIFTGTAILPAAKAAYETSTFKLAAVAK